MDIKHRFLASLYHPLRFQNSLLRLLPTQRAARLRVLLYHDIVPTEVCQFASQIRWLSQSWRFITPEQFAAIILHGVEIKEDCLLLTFDDGFISNRHVAETVLNPMGIKALFFVVSEFVDLSELSDWRLFVSSYIFPSLRPQEIPSHWKNMSWDDLIFLQETGHSIGAHTAYHHRLSQMEDKDLVNEIVLGADVLEQKLGTRVRHFAYPFGDLASFSSTALAISRTRFDFIYTNLRGSNCLSVSPWAIRRDCIAAKDSLSLVGSLLEGGADFLYKRSLASYESWGKVF